MIDYRSFTLKKLNTPEFSHLKLLLFWPFYGLAFLSWERFFSLDYHPVHCALDDKIPFCEFFLIAYLFWFVYLIGMIAYLLFTDREGFRKNAWFIIITYSVTMLIYLIYPTCQNLRPDSFARDNLFVDVVRFLYVFDTNTNVCPSIHVIGSLATLFASFHDARFKKPVWQICLFIPGCVLICLSTVFLKQHSVIDIFAALPLSLVAYWLVYHTKLFDKRV